jgi:predicted phage tail protein
MASYDDNLTVPMAHHENNNGEPPEKKRRLEMVPEVPEDQRLQEFIRNIALSSGYVQIKQEQPNQELDAKDKQIELLKRKLNAKDDRIEQLEKDARDKRTEKLNLDKLNIGTLNELKKKIDEQTTKVTLLEQKNAQLSAELHATKRQLLEQMVKKIIFHLLTRIVDSHVSRKTYIDTRQQLKLLYEALFVFLKNPNDPEAEKAVKDIVAQHTDDFIATMKINNALINNSSALKDILKMQGTNAAAVLQRTIEGFARIVMQNNPNIPELALSARHQLTEMHAKGFGQATVALNSIDNYKSVRSLPLASLPEVPNEESGAPLSKTPGSVLDATPTL